MKRSLLLVACLLVGCGDNPEPEKPERTKIDQRDIVYTQMRIILYPLNDAYYEGMTKEYFKRFVSRYAGGKVTITFMKTKKPNKIHVTVSLGKGATVSNIVQVLDRWTDIKSYSLE